MMKHFLLAIGLSIPFSSMWAQSGCTDPQAQNYNPAATINNGSCTYAAASVSLTNAIALPGPTLSESSGLIYTDGALWTHNDSGNPPAIYKISETNGSILQTVNITNASNIDWEDITADAQYIYIGDFGNNASGVRTDLRVYRISKSDITSASTVNVAAAIINFSYSDQVIGASPGANNTEFDCEAFFIKDNVLHLFSKDWVNGHTRHYQLPATPGNYVISPAEPFLDVTGLITSADISADNQVVLVGYDNGGLGIFMYLLSGFSGTDFFSGNKRRLQLGSVVDLSNSANSRGQVEAVTFTSNGNGYISSERFNHPPFDVPARLYSFSVGSFITLPVQLLNFTATYNNHQAVLSWQTASETNSSFFSIERSSDGILFSELGRQQAAGRSTSAHTYRYIDRQPLAGNNYYRLKQVDIDGNEKIYGIRKIKAPEKAPRLSAGFTGSSFLITSAGMDYNSTCFQVFDMAGSLLKAGRLHSDFQSIDIRSITKGTYLLVLSSGEKVRFQKMY